MPGYAVIGTPDHAVEAPLWRALGAATAPASTFQLHAATNAHPNAIQHRLDRWVRAGLVTRIEGKPKLYAMNDDTPRTALPPRVARDGRVTARAPTARDKLWRAMRVLRTFDLPTLVISTGVTRRSAEDMINVLHRAGYLRQPVRGNAAKATWSTYRLVRNTGPRTPSVSHRTIDGRVQRELVDANSGARIDISAGAASLRSRKADPVADGGVG